MGSHVDCVSLDIDGAFNNASREMVLASLWEVGVRGRLFGLADSFLSDTTFMTRVKHTGWEGAFLRVPL